MRNYELLDMIGDVNEDYVLSADSDVERPRFRWRTLAACAACAVLVLGLGAGLGRKWNQSNQSTADYCEEVTALHSYTIVEGGAAVEERTMAGAYDGSNVDSNADSMDGAYGAYDAGSSALEKSAAGGAEAAPAPAVGISGINQDAAIMQYDSLYKSCNLDQPPEWYAGAWLDNSYPDQVARLTVAIVDGFHTPELERQIVDWCGGGEVVFAQDMKYAYAYLRGLQEQIHQVWTDPAWSACRSMGTDVEGNCLDIGFFGVPSDEALAFLAQLDPDGDAIRVRVSIDQTIATDGINGPAPGGVTQPAPGAAEDAEGQESQQIAADPNTMGELPQEKQNAIVEGE